MYKTELIKKIQEETGYSKVQINKILQSFTKIVGESVENLEKVVLIGFGTFGVRQRSARTISHPVTKELIDVPAKQIPVFKFARKIKGVVK